MHQGPGPPADRAGRFWYRDEAGAGGADPNDQDREVSRCDHRLESMPLRDIIHTEIKAFLVNVAAERGDCDRTADSEMSAIAAWTANVVCRFT